MPSSEALLAKGKGNEAFKASDFSTAIGHYTCAIKEDPNDPTFPLNRAAAYLKLGEYEDAERDCTTVVRLNVSNVKGLFRRAQARIGLNKLADAQTDLKEALKLDPKNDAVKQDLKKVEILLSKAKSTHAGKAAAPTTSSQSTSILPNRRRIPITIVEPPAGSLVGKTKTKPIASKPPVPVLTADNNLMKSVSSRSLTSAATLPSLPAKVLTFSSPLPVSTPNTFQEAKQSRDNTKPSRAGGGIFRPSGDHTIISASHGDQNCAQPLFTPVSVSQPPVNGARGKAAVSNRMSSKPLITLFSFTRTWESFSSVQERWSLLSQIPPSTLPALFQNSLEAPHIISFLTTFQSKLNMTPNPEDSDRLRMREYMASFTQVARFKTVVLFLSKKEKELATEVWEKLGVRNGVASWGIS